MPVLTRSCHPRSRVRWAPTLETAPPAAKEMTHAPARPPMVAHGLLTTIKRRSLPLTVAAPAPSVSGPLVRSSHQRRLTTLRAMFGWMLRKPAFTKAAPDVVPAPIPLRVRRPPRMPPAPAARSTVKLAPIGVAVPPGPGKSFAAKVRRVPWHPIPVMPRRIGAMVRLLAPTGPGAAVSVVTVTPWSEAVEFLPGDEWIVTISGPSADAPKVRITMKFRTRTYSDG